VLVAGFLDDLRRVARDWLTAIFNTFAALITDRETRAPS
jgi:hypothetical protein